MQGYAKNGMVENLRWQPRCLLFVLVASVDVDCCSAWYHGQSSGTCYLKLLITYKKSLSNYRDVIFKNARWF